MADIDDLFCTVYGCHFHTIYVLQFLSTIPEIVGPPGNLVGRHDNGDIIIYKGKVPSDGVHLFKLQHQIRSLLIC